MERCLAKDTIKTIGQEVTLFGWVNARRDHGKIVFIDLRDYTSVVQVVLTNQLAGSIHSEDVIKIVGEVKKDQKSL